MEDVDGATDGGGGGDANDDVSTFAVDETSSIIVEGCSHEVSRTGGPVKSITPTPPSSSEST